MKRLYVCFFAFVFCHAGISQVVEPFSYQAIVRNTAGDVIASQTISCRFSIIKGSTSGEVVYSETQRVTTDQDGLISLKIGDGTQRTGNFSAIDWTSGNYFLKVETDKSGGTLYSDVGTTQLLIIPYDLNTNTSKKSSSPPEEENIVIVRKYAGRFLDYRQTGPETIGGPNIIWIKTTLDKTYGKISAYGKKCDFSVGENLYLKRSYYSPGGIFGYWIYQIENDSSVYYRLTDFQHDRKVLVETWF